MIDINAIDTTLPGLIMMCLPIGLILLIVWLYEKYIFHKPCWYDPWEEFKK